MPISQENHTQGQTQNASLFSETLHEHAVAKFKTAEADNATGNTSLAASKFKTAYALHVMALEGGRTASAFNVAEQLYYGRGVRKNIDEAVSLYQMVLFGPDNSNTGEFSAIVEKRANELHAKARQYLEDAKSFKRDLNRTVADRLFNKCLLLLQQALSLGHKKSALYIGDYYKETADKHRRDLRNKKLSEEMQSQIEGNQIASLEQALSHYIYARDSGIKDAEKEVRRTSQNLSEKCFEKGSSALTKAKKLTGEENSGKKSELYQQAYIYLAKAADLKHPRSMLLMAQIFENGWGIPIDLEKSLACYYAAKEARSAYCDEAIDRVKATLSKEYVEKASTELKIAKQLEKGGKKDEASEKYQEILDLLNSAVEFDNPDAMHLLGQMFENGWGIEKDLDQALAYYLAAKEEGHARAEKSHRHLQRQVGKEYYQRAKVQKAQRNYVEAADLYRKALSYENTSALLGLGELYEKGQGVREDLAMAIKCYKTAVKHGSKSGEAHLKRLSSIFTGKFFALLKMPNSIVSEDNELRDIQLYALCCEEDIGYCRLAEIYGKGKLKFVPINEVEAIRCAKLAGRFAPSTLRDLRERLGEAFPDYEKQAEAEQARHDAELNFDAILHHNTTEQLYEKANTHYQSKNYEEALDLFTQAAELHHSQSFEKLGEMHEQGLGVKADKEKASAYYFHAIRAGDTINTSASENLMRIRISFGDDQIKAGDEALAAKNYKEAESCYENAVAYGQWEGIFKIGQMFEYGHGHNADKGMAEAYYEKAYSESNRKWHSKDQVKKWQKAYIRLCAERNVKEFDKQKSLTPNILGLMTSAALIAAGVYITIQTAGATAPLNAILLSAIGGGLTGAGFESGAYTASKTFKGEQIKFKDYSVRLASGGLEGAVSGAISGGSGIAKNLIKKKLTSRVAQVSARLALGAVTGATRKAAGDFTSSLASTTEPGGDAKFKEKYGSGRSAAGSFFWSALGGAVSEGIGTVATELADELKGEKPGFMLSTFAAVNEGATTGSARFMGNAISGTLDDKMTMQQHWLSHVLSGTTGSVLQNTSGHFMSKVRDRMGLSLPELDEEAGKVELKDAKKSLLDRQAKTKLPAFAVEILGGAASSGLNAAADGGISSAVKGTFEGEQFAGAILKTMLRGATDGIVHEGQASIKRKQMLSHIKEKLAEIKAQEREAQEEAAILAGIIEEAIALTNEEQEEKERERIEAEEEARLKAEEEARQAQAEPQEASQENPQEEPQISEGKKEADDANTPESDSEYIEIPEDAEIVAVSDYLTVEGAEADNDPTQPQTAKDPLAEKAHLEEKDGKFILTTDFDQELADSDKDEAEAKALVIAALADSKSYEDGIQKIKDLAAIDKNPGRILQFAKKELTGERNRELRRLRDLRDMSKQGVDNAAKNVAKYGKEKRELAEKKFNAAARKFEELGGQISKEWKALPPDVQNAIMIGGIIGVTCVAGAVMGLEVVLNGVVVAGPGTLGATGAGSLTVPIATLIDAKRNPPDPRHNDEPKKQSHSSTHGNTPVPSPQPKGRVVTPKPVTPKPVTPKPATPKPATPETTSSSLNTDNGDSFTEAVPPNLYPDPAPLPQDQEDTPESGKTEAEAETQGGRSVTPPPIDDKPPEPFIPPGLGKDDFPAPNLFNNAHYDQAIQRLDPNQRATFNRIWQNVGDNHGTSRGKVAMDVLGAALSTFELISANIAAEKDSLDLRHVEPAGPTINSPEGYQQQRDQELAKARADQERVAEKWAQRQEEIKRLTGCDESYDIALIKRLPREKRIAYEKDVDVLLIVLQEAESQADSGK